MTETSTGTVSRALKLLAFIADAEGEVTVKHVSEAMGLAPSTVHRLLNLLRADDFVTTGTKSGTYAIGPQFYRVAARVVNRVSPSALAQPMLDSLVQQYDETVVFGLYLPAERAMSFVARSDGQQRLTYRMDMNRPLSLVWGASGKAILAYLPDDIVAEVLGAECSSPASGASPPEPTALHEQLETVRRLGYAVSEDEKLHGARGIAAPVFGATGILGSLCLTSPKGRLDEAEVPRIGETIAHHAYTLSSLLGAYPA
ncbi:IclR family transcriptional regulator [Salinicola sp. MIT1003]|uniref:IclR family transcriptional regulator n=1 Tax=Salinicola sp. MIT1003 TaxID=1882734 RepID=UPI0008DE82F0|nr:IclR family transcriptional regulator [Salinicola sp. MIT1003]OHZ01611.1 hypothetical protein BC443_11315 [Salinicola sp. MIT1003]